jgi:hypothetical protein
LFEAAPTIQAAPALLCSPALGDVFHGPVDARTSLMEANKQHSTELPGKNFNLF